MSVVVMRQCFYGIRQGFYRICLGLTVFVLVGLSGLDGSDPSSVAFAATPALTVVQQAGSPQNWSDISQRLDQMDLLYNTLDDKDLTTTRLKEIEVLFLPNLSSLSEAQVQVLQSWIQDEDGKLILAGSLSAGVPSTAKDTFRQLAGAYWLEAVKQPTSIVPTRFPGNTWTQSVTALDPIQGGVLIPVGLSSRLSATWTGDPGSPAAVISTPNSVYLGWTWGSQSQASDRDKQWLAAALSRFAQQKLKAAQLDGTATPIPVAPQAINTFEMLAMRQELSDLLGRVESSILTTNANGHDIAALPEKYQTVIAQAREVIQKLPEWAESGQSNKARQSFEQARGALWKNYPLDRLTALPEVRAIWLDRGTIVEAGSAARLEKVFDRLAAAGINTVFFETINAGFPIYPSKVAPEQNPLTRHWDPLAVAVKLAHDRQMELHAWMWTFAVGNKRHNVLPRVNLPEDYIGPVLTAHPEWANQDKQGRLFPSGQPETWLDPANGAVRRYLIAMIQEMVQDYGVDGIQLDYIRYPFQDPGRGVGYGYGIAARQKFTQQTGMDPVYLDPQSQPNLWATWTQFRADQVSQFVDEVARYVRRWNPDVILSAAVYSMPTVERLQKIQQNWEIWINNGNLDLLVPMTYAQNTRRLQQLVKPTLETIVQAPVLFLPSVNLLDLPSVEFLDQMQVVRDLPTGGYSLFATRQLNDTLQQILDQSRIPSTQIPYRQPFSAALARFETLQKEWRYLMEKQQIWIQEDANQAWQQQTDAVAALLQQLEQSPTPQLLQNARVAIEDLQRKLPDWLRLEALERPYRVNTWVNRLTALDAILRYGQRRQTLESAAAATPTLTLNKLSTPSALEEIPPPVSPLP